MYSSPNRSPQDAAAALQRPDDPAAATVAALGALAPITVASVTLVITPIAQAAADPDAMVAAADGAGEGPADAALVAADPAGQAALAADPAPHAATYAPASSPCWVRNRCTATK
jgi:hypothetical protein